MQYRKDKKGNLISILGYGCMRFTKNGVSIDMGKTEKEIMKSIAHGVNYFDTAYIYPGSEAALGEIFSKNNCRKDVYIATKLPHYLIRSKEGIDKIFNEELKRLKTDYIDYYLMHMLTDIDTWGNLKKYGIEDWIEEKLKSGQIRNIGFSYHGNSGMFIKIVDAYNWDFCQIQYNYMDEYSQAGVKGLKYASSKGLPVIIMEPLRGGRLVKYLPEKAKGIFKSYNKERSPAEWALRWLWNQKEVTCVLSGMNSLEMLRENLKTASIVREGEFSKEDYALIEKVKAAINESVKVNCTGCGYCMPCPHGVDIPATFRCYNSIYSESKTSAILDYFKCTVARKKQSCASKCIGCGKCEKHCPQGIEIRKELKKAVKELETPLFRAIKFFVKKLKLW
ncbi:MAG: aldo/keto reductase [Lachnospiraceae bacterium]|nr:aldo/keto reductase [Lachnospiraceae bacterium]